MGKAFIKFISEDGLDKAMKLNGSFLFDRKIEVERARKYGDVNSKKDPNSNVVFVGGLDFYTTANSIKKLFEEYKSLNDIRIPMSFGGTRSRGFAHIEFEDPKDVELVM